MTGGDRSPAPRDVDRRLKLVLSVLVLAPVVYMLGRALVVTRNAPYWDDIDGPLMLLIRLDAGGSWRDMLGWLFEVGNEHRMLTSRLAQAASYALTGTVNFAFFGVIGNLFVCGLCTLLIGTAGTADRKWMMALLLAGLLFQLEHFENFFWSGSSIDHFQVPLLAGAAVVLLARGGWAAWLGAGACALLATFTLAHGLLVWPVGACLLATDRRWRQLAAWLAIAALAGTGYFSGFESNPAHHVGEFSVAGLMQIGRYWLEIAGAPLAMRNATLAVGFGALLLVLLGWEVFRGGFRRERIALPLAIWAVAALGMVAIGRASLGSGVSISRYYVLSTLAWALGIFVALQDRGEGIRLNRILAWLVPSLAVFNLAANLVFAGEVRRWVSEREQAVASFVRHGRDGVAPATLHPLPQHATRVIRQAEELGVFEMPRDSEDRSFAAIQPATGLSSAIDRIDVDESLVTIDGWAAIAGRAAVPGDVHVVLRSPESQHVLTTKPQLRPDVAQAFPQENWREAGFHFSLRRWLLPAENFQVGLLIPTVRGAELAMTNQRIDLTGGDVPLERDKVAPNRMVYDELIPRRPESAVTAVPRKFMRVSFFDLQEGLVHVDFSGPGEMTVRLEASAPLEPLPRNRDRPVAHLKGSAVISIAGADEQSNLAVFAARRQPRRISGPKPSGAFDGRAHITSISIASLTGKFGGVRAGNVIFSAHSGFTGIRAPNVRFAGPVNLGDIHAEGTAVPGIELGFAEDTRIAGGDLHQPNGRPVSVSGLRRLNFVEGRTAQGFVLPAKANRAILQQDGKDVSAGVAGSRPQEVASPLPPGK